LTGFEDLHDFYPDNPIILKILIQTTGTKKPPLSFQKGGFCFIRDALAFVQNILQLSE
jgi:hypothetical protein